MNFSASQIAQLIQGTVEGDLETTIHGFGKIEEAQQGEITFLANPKYESYLYTTNASIVIINNDYQLTAPITATLVRVKDAYQRVAVLLQLNNDMMQQSNVKVGIEQPCFIDPSATIGDNVYIGAFAYIGKGAVLADNAKIYPNAYVGNSVTVGVHSVLHPHVIVYDKCVIGNQVIIHSGTIIGADGFGFAPQADGSFKKIPQLGNVVIEDNVEIGSNTTVDRATMGSTIIKSGVKLDNLIQIAHNVEIGSNSVIAAQTGISGSTKLGDNCMVGGQVGIVGHINLAEGTKINAQSGVSKGIKEKGVAITGSPAFEYKQALKSQSVFRKLPELLERLEYLEQQLLKNNSSDS